MKLRYDSEGIITAVSVDSFPLGGDSVVSIPDSMDLLHNPGKYTYDVSSHSLRLNKYIKLTVSSASVPANSSPITITITAYTPDGAADTTAAYSGTLIDCRARFDGAPSLIPFTLSAGVASVPISSSSPKSMDIAANCGRIFGDQISISFV